MMKSTPFFRFPLSKSIFRAGLAFFLAAQAASSVSGAYAFWAEQYFSPVQLRNASLEATLWGMQADPDGDGVKNLAEYAFGGLPRVAKSANLPKISASEAGVSVSFVKLRADLEYRIEYSENLSSGWTQEGLEAAHADLDNLQVGEIFELDLSTVAPTAAFARVQVNFAERDKMPIGTNFWNFRWGTGRADYFESNVNWSTVVNPWRQRFLDEISIYSVIRWMDQVPTNGSSVSNWNQRVAKTANHNDTSGGAVAYEWQVDLCNRVGADIWVTLPHRTIESYLANPNDNYWTRLAELIKSQLDPELKVYVEYSNETWSGGSSFSQGDYVGEKGVEMGFSTDPQTAKYFYHVYAATRLHQVFVDVFGEESDRVVKVIAGHAAQSVGTRSLVTALQNQRMDGTVDERLNPSNIIPDYIAIANYIQTGDGAAPNIRELWTERLEFNHALYTNHLREIFRSGLSIPLISYEGGQHYTTNAHTFSTNPESYDMYMEWLEMVSEFFQLTMHYTHTGTWASGGSWGAKSSTNQSVADAHRYRALRDWVLAED